MSEVKRVAFTTISSTVSVAPANSESALMSSAAASAASLRFGSDFAEGGAAGGGSSEPKGGNKTVRLNLELFATDSSTYPEFNYSKLLHLEKKKLKKLKQKSNGFAADPFEENDDDVARIAKELEKKYGSTYGSGRGRSKKDDHCDIGLGYDESDSFIDNTEAYDEVIPEEVETLEGGFYINCGALEFKKLHNESTTTKTDEIIKMPNRPKKRVLSSSSEDSSSSDEDDDDDDDEDDSDEDQAEVEGESKASGSSGPAEKRLKGNVTPASTSQGSQTKKRDSISSSNGKKKDKPAVGLSFSSSNSPKPSVDDMASDSDKERTRLKTVKTTTVKDMLKAKRDSFLKMQEGGETKPVNGELKGAATKSSDDDSSEDDSDGSGNNSDSNLSAQTNDKKGKKSEESSEKLRSSDTKLPELDAELMSNLQLFKDIVKSKNLNGKKFVFDDKLTELFLKIDEESLCIEKQHRNMVYAHLEFHLSLPKYYFLRKAKQLRIKEEKLKSKRALAKLRNAVIEVMPKCIAEYEVELRKYADLQSNNLNSDNPPKMPKKRFPWNENMRNNLYEVYQVRWTSYPVLGTRKESLEDFISSYMKGKVVQLWPSGWMRYEDLQKEIEKRKVAAKKAKEKKKESSDPTSSNRPSLPAQTVTSNAAASSAAAQAAAALSYMKTLEDLTVTNSRGNSDTDSVASSGQSGGVKRKKTENPKASKSKTQKITGESDKQFNQGNGHNNNNESGKKLPLQPPAIVVDISSPSKRTDHSIHSIISSAPLTQPSSTLTTSLATIALNQQQKHSGTSCTSGPPPAHVINLDNYKSASDILMTSQQLLGTNALPIKNERAKVDPIRRESSSDSDVVEIVGVFPAKPLPAMNKTKHKKNSASNQGSRSATPTHNNSLLFDATTNSKSGNAYSPNNNNNAYGKGNKKGSANKLASNEAAGKMAVEFDVNNVVNVLKELEEFQQQQKQHPIMSQNASGKDPNQ